MGRSIHFNWKSIEWILRIVNEHDSSLSSEYPQSAKYPSVNTSNEGKSINFISFQINNVLSIIVVLENPNVDFPNSIDSNEGRSIW